MTTPWERITDEAYKVWLLEAMTTEEYNDSSARDRRLLLTDFREQQSVAPLRQQQQDGEWSCCSRILVINALFEYGNTHYSSILLDV